VQGPHQPNTSVWDEKQYLIWFLGEVNIDTSDESYGALDESNRTIQDKPGLLHTSPLCLFKYPNSLHQAGVLWLLCCSIWRTEAASRAEHTLWDGLHRIVSVIQGDMSNYGTDTFTPHFDPTHKVQECSHTSGSWTVRPWIIEYRVVPNHIHTLTVAITDGGESDATGHGYVVCHILWW